MSILIRNGTVVSAVEQYKADILVEGEVIKAIGRGLSGDQIIDADGMYVLPGGVDNHTHFKNFDTTCAALVGGTTTIVNFVGQQEGAGLLDSVARFEEERVAGRSAADYAFHPMITNPGEEVFQEVSRLPEIGVCTVKLFMAYKGTPLYVNDSALFRTLQSAKSSGVTVMVHAENAHVIDELQKQCLERGQVEPKYHAISRPPLTEAECVTRAITLAELADAPLFIVHVSCREAMEAVRDGYKRGVSVYGETCPQYLVLTDDDLSRPGFEGAKFVCSPPLRPSEQLGAMWEAIQKGWLQIVGTDHVELTFKGDKQKGLNDFTKIPNGLPGVQYRLPVLWTYGVEEGKLSRQRLVDVFATAPAKVNGLFPKKGTIAVGSDADLLLLNPEPRSVIRIEDSLEGLDYTSFEGLEQKGRVETVLLRGSVVVDRGSYIRDKPQGKFVRAQPFGLCYSDQSHPGSWPGSTSSTSRS